MAKKSDTTADNLTGDAKRPNEPAEVVTYWLNEIAASRKREKQWRKEGERILEIYGGEKKDSTPFNILFSNTETLLPALYSAVPRPVVQRRFKDEDPVGKHSAVAGQRMLEFLVDTNIDGYETFDEGVRSATLDGLLPGRGVTCVKYDSEINETTPEKPKEGEQPKAPEAYKGPELVCLDSRSWNRVHFGYAKKWSKVPWIAYEEHVDKEEATRLFGKPIADKIVFTSGEDRDREDDKKNDDEKNQGERKTACIYQIWDKDGGKRIRYISSQYHEGYLKDDEDTLELTGFFNIPKPLQFIEKSNSLLPVAPYLIYENQAKELNQLTLRINKIVRAIKARGIFDSELGDDIKNLMDADDNALVPADKSASLAAEKGLQNAIWFMPVEQLVNVLTQLYAARENCKRVIYEITGISDIIRGSTVASETATAQEIKSQWGTLRLKRLQKEVQRYARDLLRMMLEVAATNFSAETWAKMTGLPFLLDSKFNELTAVSEALKQKLGAMKQQVEASGQNIQEVPPPPELQQLQDVMQQLQTPKWSDILSALRDDMQRAYRIDIETNSTVEPEAAEDQKNISEMMTAMGQYLNGVGPLVAKGVMPFGAAQSMLLAIARRFRFGTEIEEYIKAMQAPKPEDDGAAQAQLQAQQQQMQKDQQAAQQKMADEAEKVRLSGALEKKTAENDLNKRDADLRGREAALQAEKAIFEIQKKAEADCKAASDKVSTAQKELHAERAAGKSEKAQMKAEHSTQKLQEKEKVVSGKAQAATGIVKQEIKPIIDALSDLGERVQELLDAANAPKTIERGPDGKAKSVGGRPVVRDEQGRAMGLN